MKILEKWFPKKRKLNSTEKKDTYFKEREIWWCYLGINVGSEQNGHTESFLRPMLIIRKFSKQLFVALPLSTKSKNKEFEFELEKYTFLKKKSFLICSQIRLLSFRRLYKKIGIIPKEHFQDIKIKSAETLFKIPASELQ